MIRSTVKTFSHVPQFSKRIDDAAREGVTAAAAEAAKVAQGAASLDLKLEVLAPRPTPTGWEAGVESHRQTDNPQRTTPIALFFDKGTLGRRRGKLSSKTRRKAGWTDKRGRTYARGPIDAESGIPAEKFFLRARIAGRKKLLARILAEGR